MAKRPVGHVAEPALTDEVIENVSAIVRMGAPLSTSLRACDVEKSSHDHWTRRARKAKDKLNANPQARLTKYEKLCIEYRSTLRKAKAESELIDVQRIDDAAGDGVWQAAAWRLERRYPGRYSLQRLNEGQRVEVAVQNNISTEDGDVSVTAGVLVVGSLPSTDSWYEKYGGDYKLPPLEDFESGAALPQNPGVNK